MSCSTFGLPNFSGIHSNVTVKDSALRAKLKAIQSAARLISEMLLCKKGSKLKRIYAVLLVVVAARLYCDWGMENMATNAYKTRSPKEWAKISGQWHRDYEECKTDVEAPDKHYSLYNNKTDADIVRDGIAGRKQLICRNDVFLSSCLSDVVGHAAEIAEFRKSSTYSLEGADVSNLNDAEFLQLRRMELRQAKNEVTKLKSWLDDSTGECYHAYADEIREFRQKQDAGFNHLGNFLQVAKTSNSKTSALRKFSLHILGASTPDEVSDHYKELAIRYHPDKPEGNTEITEFLNQVRNFLKRFDYKHPSSSALTSELHGGDVD